MARIPDELPLDPVSGPTTPIISTAPTDFGLEGAGAELGQVANLQQRTRLYQARDQARADAEAVAPDVIKLQEANGEQMATDAPRWNGQPGFAADQVASYAERAQRFADNNQTYTPGQRAEFKRRADQVTAAQGSQALSHEQTVLMQTAVDQQNVIANGALANFQTDFAARKQQLVDGYDGSQAGLTAGVLGAFDAASAPAIAAAPEPLRPGLSARLSAMRVQEAAETSATEAKGRDAFVLKNAGDQANGLINTIASNPSAYDSVVTNNLPGIVATMPAGLRRDALTELTGMAAQARVRGLIAQQNFQQAKTELDDGRYDAVMKPEVKEQLVAQVEAENRAHGPAAIDRAYQSLTLRQHMAADEYARLTTGRGTGLSLDVVAAGVSSQLVSPEEAAAHIAKTKAADRAFAAVGPIRQLPTAQVAAAANAPMPDPADPDYAVKLATAEASKQAAAAELQARGQPGQWAWTADAGKAKAGVAGGAANQDAGTWRQWAWGQVLANGRADGTAATYAGSMLIAQKNAGIAASAYQIVPQTEAERLAASVVQAQPEQRAAAMAGLARTIAALPAAFSMPDGSMVSPRAILGRQLAGAHLTPLELSTVLDYGGNPAALGRVTAALNDTTLTATDATKGLARGPAAQLRTAVIANVSPYLASLAPLPGEGSLAQGRIDRTMLVARSLMANQHMSAPDAARAAAADMTNGYVFADSWRMPAALAAARVASPLGVGSTSGVQLARGGAAETLAGLLEGHGTNLYAPAGGAGSPDDQRRLYALQIQHNARWVTTPDNGGLALMVPHPDGTWDQVSDRFGRPVSASWSQLQGVALGHAKPAFVAPPPNHPTGPNGQPVPATSKGGGFQALSWAVQGQESGFGRYNKSAAGALGLMGVMPDTVKTYAPQVGLPVDLDRAEHDPDYNRRIGEAALSDNINHFGSSPAGLGLALAGYNAGRGRLDGYTDRTGYHPGWLQTIGDPRRGQISLDEFVRRIPFKETRAYVQAVLPAALGRLQGGG